MVSWAGGAAGWVSLRQARASGQVRWAAQGGGYIRTRRGGEQGARPHAGGSHELRASPKGGRARRRGLTLVVTLTLARLRGCLLS